MGKASRGKKQRTRDVAGSWSSAAAARTAHRARTDTMRLLPGNTWVHALMASNAGQRLSELFSVIGNSDVPVEAHESMTLAMTVGKQGLAPPWPHDPNEMASWQIDQILHVLGQGELFVLTPAAHAAAMAATATLEPADVATLDRERDLPARTGLVVLPEPVVVANRGGTLSDTLAYGWQCITQHQILPKAAYAGVQVTTFMDRDGPVQPADWQAVVSTARALGSPLPPLVPDGMYGLRGDSAASDWSGEQLSSLSTQHRQLNTALNQAAGPGRGAPEVGEWDGGTVQDVFDDFTARYMFALWRLMAQGITTTSNIPGPRPGNSVPAHSGRRHTAPEPEVRVIRLARPPAGPEAATETATRRYRHRWPVRMHKVRQWYPSLKEHKVIWRGPYIKGPADAPLLTGEKVYLVDG